MLKLHDIDGKVTFIAPTAISRIVAPMGGYSAVRAILRLFDGSVVEVRETPEEVAAMIERARDPSWEMRT